jgi:hypothetical protein
LGVRWVSGVEVRVVVGLGVVFEWMVVVARGIWNGELGW